MKGDFTRWTFDASKRYSSVRLQQGRVLLDADWNEQLDIVAHREQIANQEIIGINGVPDLDSFDVDFGENGENSKIKLEQGECYVEGILCENKQEDYKLEITEIPGILEGSEKAPTVGSFLVYLEVWQHHITAIEEQDLLEPALGGPDTTTRTQTYWRLKAEKLANKTKWREEWGTLRSNNEKKGKLKVESGEDLPNDLYRVEIHEVGDSVDNTTFKWARNNASMAARVTEIGDKKITILKNNQIQFPQQQGEKSWIEITDEELVKAGKPGLFLKVDNVEDDNTLLIIDADTWPEGISNFKPAEKITTVRIWEAEARTIAFLEEEKTSQLIELEKGLKVNFVDATIDYTKYRTGDYWLIPTRSQDKVEWAEDKESDGILYDYCPLAIVEYADDSTWSVKQDCREVFPALTEMARETELDNGRKLSIGVHSYNDARRTDKVSEHADDQLNIQGGKELTLNAGYWKDNLDGDVPETEETEETYSSIIFSINEEEVMRLGKDDLEITDGKNLVVDGTSWLKGVVAIGTQEPEQNIGLLVQPNLSADSGNEAIGELLAPSLTATSNQQSLTALHINPTFENGSYHQVPWYGLIVEKGKVLIGPKEDPQNGLDIGVDLRPKVHASNTEDKLVGLRIKPHFHNRSQGEVSHYGLVVERGKVGIGNKTLDTDIANYQIGVDVRPVVHASDSEDKLVGLYINPEFKDDCTCGITDEAKYGLLVEGGRVAFGPKLPVGEIPENQEYLVDIGTDTDGGPPRLKVAGDLEVYGKVTFHADPSEPGDVELGQQNEDQIKVYGKLETLHTSGKLKVTSPLEIELKEDGAQDFLSLFAANEESNDVDGRIVWKKGTVTHPGEDPGYEEQAKEVAAIYSSTTGDGTSDITAGDLRFGTSPGGEDATLDRMVITADGKVGIGTDDPVSELEVAGTSTLETLVVNTNLQVPAGADTEMDTLKLTGAGSNSEPTLAIPSGNVCIGTNEIPDDDEGNVNGRNIKLYLEGDKNYDVVSFRTGLSVFGSTDVDKLTVTPRLDTNSEGSTLIAARIEPNFILNGKAGIKKLALQVAQGDIDIDDGDLNIKSGKLVFGNSPSLTDDKLSVVGNTLLEGDLQVKNGANVALKVNQATQEVGIGAASLLGYKLAVAGNTNLAGKLEVTPQNINGVGNAVEIKPKFTGNGTQTAVLIEPTFAGNGRLKFGLHVVKENVALCSTSGGVAIGSNNPDGHKLRVTDGTTYLEEGLIVHSGGVTLDSGDLKLTSGNVAIGSSDPDGHKLRVTGGTTHLEGELKVRNENLVLQVSDNTQEQGVLFQNSGDHYTWRIYREDASNNYANLKISGGLDDNHQELSDYVTLDHDGNMGIGTTDPQAKLQVVGGAIMPAVGHEDNSGILFPKNPGAGAEDAAWIRYYPRTGEETTFEIGTSDNDTDHIVLKTEGAVGITSYDSDTVPDISGGVKLDVDGAIRTTDDVLTNSDATLKDNIQTLKDGLGKILGLRGVSYQWKDKRRTVREQEIGLVAQEVEAMFPEIVSTDSQGIKSMSYSKLIAPLIEAIKEQQGQISELVNQVKQQQTQINKLQARKK